MPHMGMAGAGLEQDMFHELLRLGRVTGCRLLQSFDARSCRTGMFCWLLSLTGVGRGHANHILVHELQHQGYRTSTNSKMLYITGSSKMLQTKRSTTQPQSVHGSTEKLEQHEDLALTREQISEPGFRAISAEIPLNPGVPPESLELSILKSNPNLE